MRRIKKAKEEAELDITSFMNLMIVLVPVLLLNMVFSQTVVLEIKLPAAAQAAMSDPKKNEQIEVIARDDHLVLNYPAGVLVTRIPNIEGNYDYQVLSEKLQAMKQLFIQNEKDKKDILILLQQDVPYQKLVTLMDTVRAFYPPGLSTTAAELFPDISLGDAPDLNSQKIAGGKG